MSLKGNFISSIFSGAGGFLLKAASNLLLIPLLFKALGTENFGVYVFIISLSDLLVIMDAGLTTGLIHRLSHYISLHDTDSIREQISMGQIVYGSIALLMVAVGFILGPVLPRFLHLSTGYPVHLAVTAFTLVFLDSAVNIYGCLSQSVLKAHCQYQWTNLADTCRSVFANISSIILVSLGYGLVEIMVARLFITFLANIALLLRATRTEPNLFRFQAHFCAHKIKKLFEISIFAMLQRMSAFIALKMDDFVIAGFLTLVDVGLYGLVYRIFSQVMQFSLRIMEGLFPVFVRFASSNNEERSRFFFLRVSTFVNFLISLLLILIMANYPEIIHFMGAGKIPFQQTLTLGLIVTCIAWNVAIQFPASNYLFAANYHRYLTTASLITSFCNLGISIALVQILGTVGVALGTLIPQFIQYQFFNITRTCKELKISMQTYLMEVHLKNWTPLGILTLLTFGGRWLAGWSHPAELVLLPLEALGVSMAGILWFFHTASDEEREMVFTRLDKLTPGLSSTLKFGGMKNRLDFDTAQPRD